MSIEQQKNIFLVREEITMKNKMITTLTLIMMFCTLHATAATEIPSKLVRDIKLQNITLNNEVIPGISPTTGLPSNNTEYMPILTQIDNNLGAIPQWGISLADIMYELPIQGQGWTRLTALFSDRYPQEAGPVRSGRVMHADLREEWDAVLVFYGMQEAPGSNMKEALSKYGVTSKNLAIDGIGNKYQDFLKRVKYHGAPHNVSAYIANLHDLLLKQDYSFPLRPFLFTDEINYDGAKAKQFSIIHKENKDTSSTFVFDEALNGYSRFTELGAYVDYLQPTEIITYSNVIIQRTKLSFNNSSMNPILPDVVGSGAADIFLAGQYVAGAWTRDKYESRTVFYDQNGVEISLQRGKTWIIICDDSTKIFVDDAYSTNLNSFQTSVTKDENDVVLSNKDISDISFTSSELSNTTGSQNFVLDDKTEILVLSQDDITEKLFATVRIKDKGKLNLRKTASTKSKVLLYIPNGSMVIVVEKGSEWTHINFEDKDGYVMTKFLEF